MQKDVTYHRSAVEYNEALAVVAEEQAEKVEHPEVQKWCRSVGKQHRFHAKRHQSALEKLERELGEKPWNEAERVIREELAQDVPASTTPEVFLESNLREEQEQFASQLEAQLNDGKGI